MSYVYGPVSQSEDSLDEKSLLQESETPAPRKDRLLRWAVAAILLCSIVDIACLAYLVVSPSFKSEVPHYDLPYRSTFTNLEKYYVNPSRKTTPRGPINNIPRVLVQVDSSRPDEIFPVMNKRLVTDGGLVPYDERRFYVTPHISTVAEFHVLDFGMELCSVSLEPPNMKKYGMEHGKMNGKEHSEEHGTSGGYRKRHEGMSFDVWMLDHFTRVEPGNLSWNTKPKQLKKLGSLTYSHDTISRLEPFNCTSGSIFSLEVVCGSGNCDLDLPATMFQTVGLHVQQLQTV